MNTEPDYKVDDLLVVVDVACNDELANGDLCQVTKVMPGTWNHFYRVRRLSDDRESGSWTQGRFVKARFVPVGSYTDLKIGDYVRLNPAAEINNDYPLSTSLIKFGEICRVIDTFSTSVKVVPISGRFIEGELYWAIRFEKFVSQVPAAKPLTPNKPQPMKTTQPRLPNGRFTTTSAPTPTAPITGLMVTSTQRADIPTKFRAGSIYRVVGGSTGRFVSEFKIKGEPFAIISVHGRPVPVKPSRVRFATKEDVEAYLEDGKVTA